jgi:AcrR family transcriptional regulator
MTSDSDFKLPESIAAVWGVRERPVKGPKPGLSLERIVEAGIAVAAAHGIGAVSMNRVAAELGTSAMSLYRYVRAKDELLTLMVDAAFGAMPPLAAGIPWREGLEECAWFYHRALYRHPWTLRVPISGPPLTPHTLTWLEHGLRALSGTGLAEHEKMSVLLLLSSFVRSEAALMLDIVTASTAAGISPESLMPAYGKIVASLASPEQFPALHAVIAAGVFDRSDDPDDEFVFGLNRVLDGIEALIRERQATPA